MTSATVRGDKSTGYAESRGLGLVFFAATMLLAAGPLDGRLAQAVP